MSIAKERHDRLLAILAEHRWASAAELADKLGCSLPTVRRDLRALAEAGRIERSHGGAAATGMVSLEFTLDDRAQRQRAEKQAIAALAAEMVEDGEHLLIDTGSTPLMLAEALRGRRVTVVTTSLAVVSTLIGAEETECILLGGQVRSESPDCFGPLVEHNLGRIQVDRAFLGCDGLSSAGPASNDERVARICELIIAASAQVVLLADGSKAGRRAFVRYADFGQIHDLISDPSMSSSILKAAQTAGTRCHIAQGSP